ncbi:four-carbon acid sugar kinase family protein [Mahella australiensis]|uniref:Type III effector Hrp-dependent outer protein n=1 Tax=Mahella australiensis (strain DSM 15567 / CIP 107919 / 50-1 BON) TaxID=697281 RepID=F3ZVB3_MAHA5|nr:four-carbon acid sugar kinase family protein [Mahella australiensis]AEE95263.1 type III effector Hrp-dependent outer protein [Mahella australiensis 50-1 BON]
MAKIAVIADDLTGANATGILLKGKGFTAATVMDTEALDGYAPRYDVLSATTNSRSMSAERAYKSVKCLIEQFKAIEGIKLFCKRIDTTLRGNIGAEIDAALDALGHRYTAVVVPAYPLSGRVCAGGYVLVDNMPLQQTDVASDPKTPVSSSKVADIISKQSRRMVVNIGLDQVMAGQECLCDAINNIGAGGIVVIDATMQNHIDVIANACCQSVLPIMPVDPGPFSAAMAAALCKEEGKATHMLLIVGSVSELTRRQVDTASRNLAIPWIAIDVPLLLSPNRDAEMQRVFVEVGRAFRRHPIVGIATAMQAAQIVRVEDMQAASAVINKALADITLSLLNDDRLSIKALYTSGGDVTAAICAAVGADSIELKGEALPLATYGRLIGGEFAGLPLITKGGLVGGDDAIIKCIEYLRKVADDG